MGLPLQTATSGNAPSSWPLPPTPASWRRQRRPAGTYFYDTCSHRAGRPAPSVRYQSPMASPLPSATSGLLYRLFQQPRRHPRREKCSLHHHEHRRHLPWPTLKDYYSVNAWAHMYTADHSHSTSTYAIRHLLQPTVLRYYSLVFSRHRAPAVSSANTPPSLVRARSSSTRFTGSSSVSSAPTASSANTTTSPSRDRSAAAHPSTTTSCV